MKKISSEYRVSIGDINYGGHMGNDKSLIVFHNARINYLKHFGYSELNVGNGLGVILAEANISYKKEVFLDDILQTEVWVSEIKGLKWTISYRAIRDKDNAVVFTGKTLMVCYDYKNKKVGKIPEDFLKEINSEL